MSVCIRVSSCSVVVSRLLIPAHRLLLKLFCFGTGLVLRDVGKLWLVSLVLSLSTELKPFTNPFRFVHTTEGEPIDDEATSMSLRMQLLISTFK